MTYQYELSVLADTDELPPFGEILCKQDKDGQLAIHWAAQDGKLEAIKNLVARGVDPREVNKDGLSAFDICLDKHFFNIADWLLENGETLEPRAAGFNALDYPAMQGDVVSTEYLIEKGAAIDGALGEIPPLVWATQEGHFAEVELLLKNGASPFARSGGDGQTAVEMAAGVGDMEMVILLLSGMQKDRRAKLALTRAIEIAEAYEHWDIAQFISNEGQLLEKNNLSCSKIAIWRPSLSSRG
jgi:ankyrin repeat protein